MNAWLHRDDGATLPLVALMLVAIVGMTSLVVDLGNGWRIRRALIPATDSAALAAAQDYASGDDGCALSAGSYVTQNESAATMVSCVPQTSGSNGYVTVTAEHNVQTWFAQVIGLGDYTVTSTSSASWSDPSAVVGLRPIGLCLGGSEALQEAVTPPVPDGPTFVHVPWTKEQPDACGDTEGNWGTIDLDGEISGGNQDMIEWIINGYSGPVPFEQHPYEVTSCTDEEHCLPADTGADIASGIQELNDLVDGDPITLPLFDFVENNGGTARYHIVGLVRAVLDDFRVNGAAQNRYIDLWVEPGFVPGLPGGDGSATGGTKVVSMCAVDATSTSGCLP